MSRLEVDEVSVRFGGHMAVDRASLRAPAGSITGLIGPNGAGKTTLFNVICGLQVPLRGQVSIEGADVTRASTHERARRGLARTFQRLELFGSLTVRENLQVAAEAQRSRSGSTESSRIDHAATRTGLGALLDRRADVLTTGQARLVELARALVTEPTVLLLDEPASGLDAEETERFATLLLDIAADGPAILLVEHDIPLVMRVCERIYVLDFGRVIANGSPEQVREDRAVIEAYLGTPTKGVEA